MGDMADLLPTMILRGDGQPRKFRKDGIFLQFALNDQNFNSKNELFQKPLSQQDQVHLQIFSEQRNRSIPVKKKKKLRPNFLNSTLKITDPTGLKLTPSRYFQFNAIYKKIYFHYSTLNLLFKD